jgi:sodium pump decarboxylase gamma subunit
MFFGLSVTTIGLVIVFAGLIVLIGFIKLVSVISNSNTRKKKSDTDNAAADENALPAVEFEQGIDPETVAAITAAIAAVWQGDTGFIVRRVRRIHNAAAWNLAGREDQVYSRM